MTKEEIKKMELEAFLYAEGFALKTQEHGWHKEKMNDFAAGYISSNRECTEKFNDIIIGMKSEIEYLKKMIYRNSECEHNNTDFRNIRCNCCNDCGEIIEIDI